jgi:hypothetical protein
MPNSVVTAYEYDGLIPIFDIRSRNGMVDKGGNSFPTSEYLQDQHSHWIDAIHAPQ